MNYEKLQAAKEHGTALIIDIACEGTCQLWEYMEQRFVCLADNTVITQEEDNAFGVKEAIFPKKGGREMKKEEKLIEELIESYNGAPFALDKIHYLPHNLGDFFAQIC